MNLLKQLAALVLVLLCMLAGTLWAHEGRPVFIQVKALSGSDANQQQYLLQWKTPPVFPQGTEPSISLEGYACTSTQPQLSQTLIGRKHYSCNISSTHPTVKIDYPDANPALSSLLVFQNMEGNSQHVFSGPDKLLIQIPEAPGAFTIANQYIKGGVQHILQGYDHLLFVLCLLLIAGSLRRILLTITGFTLAHTLTLILTTLNVLSLPFALVEALIALSIVVLAAETLKGRLNPEKTSITWRYPMLVASLFGLLHGFGFASILSNLGLPQNMKMSALLFFNLGVELGQLAFIIAVLLLVWLGSKITSLNRYQDNVVQWLMYFTGVTATFWLVQGLVSI